FLARQSALGRLVALKVLRAGPWATDQQRKKLVQEARLAARLDHPGIVAVHAAGEYQGRVFIAMQHAKGGSLDKRLGRPWPVRDAVELVLCLARAVGHAHAQGIVHRDLKPANVLLGEGPERVAEPKVADFGLARQVGQGSGTASGVVLGTPAYMAPEQAAGKTRQIGPAADVHALGAILYECLTGAPPFAGGSLLELLQRVRDEAPRPPRERNPEVPADLEAILQRCLAKKPEARYPHAQALAEDLERLLAGRPVEAARPPKQKRSHAKLLLGALVGVAALAVVLAIRPWSNAAPGALPPDVEPAAEEAPPTPPSPKPAPVTRLPV